MCNWVTANNTENQFAFFMYLKLTYSSGKVQWNKSDKNLASLTLLKNEKTVISNFDKCVDLGWIEYDTEYNFYRIISFEKIRVQNNWELRRAFPFSYEHLVDIRAVLGAVIFTQLYKSYLKKYFPKRRSNVLLRESASKSPAFFYDKKRYAEISVLSVKRFFNLTLNKATRIKKLAADLGLIEVKKQYYKLNPDQVYAAKKGAEFSGAKQNIIFRNGNCYLQLIDKIYTELYFKRRKKLETL